MIAHHFRSRERTDRGAQNHVARPVAIVVHPRNAHGGSPAVHSRTNRVRRPTPPATRLGAHCRGGGEGGKRVAGWERSVIVAGLEAAQQLEVVWVGTDGVDERTRAT